MAPRQDVLQSLLTEKPKNVKVAAIKDALMQGIEEVSAEAFKLRFHYAHTGIKSSFFRFLEMTLAKVDHPGILDFILTKNFHRLLQSKVFLSALLEKIGALSTRPQVFPIVGLGSS